MRTKDLIYWCLPIVCCQACSTATPKAGIENTGKEVVVATMNDMSKPKWVQEAMERTYYVDGNEVVSVGSTSLPSDSRIEAGFRISELKGREALARVLQVKLENFSHLAEEGVSFDGIQLRNVTAEAAKITASGMKSGRRYYEKVAVTQDNGVPRTEIRFYLETRMSREDFKRAGVELARRANGKSTLSEVFSKQVEKHSDRWINGTLMPMNARRLPR
jgi:hypothetical protein